MELAFQELGSGPAIVLLHGFPLDGRVWLPVAQHLSVCRRVIVPDLRGFGRSTFDGTFTLRDLADDVAELIRRLEVQPVTLVGLSMGGYVAMELAARQGELLSRLVLVDTKADADDDAARSKRDEMAALARSRGTPAVAAQMLPNMLADASSPHAEELQAIMHDVPADTVARASLAMRDRPDHTATLAALQLPVVVIVGEHDRITPPAKAQAMAGQLRRGKLVQVAAAGHMSPLEQPQAVAEAILSSGE